MQGGGLVEICVFDTTYEDWVKVLDGLGRAGFQVRIDDIESGVPAVLSAELFGDGADVTAVASVSVDDQVWTAPLAETDTVQLQGDPGDIGTEVELNRVIAFMEVIGRAIAKPVSLIPETVNPRAVEPYLTVGQPA